MENCTYPYKRIIHDLECGALSGRLAPGESIPSVRVLAAKYQVNSNTVQRALKELAQKGLIVSRRSNKKVVTEDTERIHRFRQEMARERTRSFLTKMEELGYSHEQIRDLCCLKRQRNGGFL